LQNAASLVLDVNDGTIFEAANNAKRWPTASITKLMTATVAEDKIDPLTKITITEEMFTVDPSEPTLVVGGTYTAADLTNLMLLPSSNVAAEALASFYGRGIFLDGMNARAAAWGMTNTYFSDPSGVSTANQSTAHDLAQLAMKVYASYPEIFTVTRTVEAYVMDQSSGKKTLIKNINNFAGDADFIGGKTGHTDEAAGNLLSVFRYGGRSIVIIVLGTDDRFGDTRKLYDWFKHAY
jgi:D-alanyl-D-alanine carboxypeptidase